MSGEEDTNFYNPDESDEPTSSAIKDSKKQSITWTASEYLEHQRGAGWYITLAVTTTVLAAIIYLLIGDYFATGTVVVMGIIVGSFAGHKPRQITYEVGAAGIKVGDKAYPYSAFKSFSVSHSDGMSNINLYPLKRFMPVVSAFFDAKDEKRIIDSIGQHLPLEQRKTDNFDNLSRRLKL